VREQAFNDRKGNAEGSKTGGEGAADVVMRPASDSGDVI
jgi:hypothetical protein